MVDLETYIKQKLKEGYSPESIKKVLLKNNYDENKIDSMIDKCEDKIVIKKVSKQKPNPRSIIPAIVFTFIVFIFGIIIPLTVPIISPFLEGLTTIALLLSATYLIYWLAIIAIELKTISPDVTSPLWLLTLLIPVALAFIEFSNPDITNIIIPLLFITIITIYLATIIFNREVIALLKIKNHSGVYAGIILAIIICLSLLSPFIVIAVIQYDINKAIKEDTKHT